jgi:predicted TIM-barrel fold metal-dependent hydrolase
MRIIDTHLHLIDLKRLRYPWLDGEPALKRDFTLDQYRAQAVPAGIESMLHMEVDVVESDQERETEWVTAIGGGVIGAVAGCRPEHASFPSQLERLAANPMVRGLRRTFHFTPDELPQQPLFVENIRRVARYGLAYDLWPCRVSFRSSRGLRRRRRTSSSSSIIAASRTSGNGSSIPGAMASGRLAALPNVACKIFGIIAYGDPKAWTVDDLRPFFEHAVNAFGWSRLVWGSDWPVCTLTADLTRWVETTHRLLAGASESEKMSLLSGNAERLYRLV